MDVVTEFRARLQADGLHGALAFLNARTRHRYTGVYRFIPPVLRNISLFDRENPEVRALADQPIEETYCGIIRTRGAPFLVNDATIDSRVAAHPARRSVVAYHAVPLLDATDRCFGSLCHWDVRPRMLPAGELEVMLDVAPLIARVVERKRNVRERGTQVGTRPG